MLFYNRRFAFPWLAAMLVAVSACGDDPAITLDPEEDRFIVTVTLKNNDALPVHMFVGTESFPCCQVAPGNTRPVTVTSNRNETILVQAGRNGVILASRACVVTSKTMNPTFANGSLVCGN